MDLQQLREKLEKIDKKLASLFEERMKVIEKVRVYKNSNNIPVYDSNRERNMHDKYEDYINISKINDLSDTTVKDTVTKDSPTTNITYSF